MNEIINWIIIAFLVLGALDYGIGCRYGLGKEFENGILASGRLLFCMGGFMVLAPVMAQILSPLLAPVFRFLGADPSMIAGILLANDAGGASLAVEMAIDPAAGRFSGWIVGATMGTTIMLTFPYAMNSTTREQKPAVIYGFLFGVITIPLGNLLSGLAAGYSALMICRNLIPVLIVSLTMAAGLICLKEKMVTFFIILGRLITAASCVGLMLGGIELVSGKTLIPSLGDMKEAFVVVGGITVFLAGAFPMIALIRRVFGKYLACAGKRIGLNEAEMSGLLMTTANALPTFQMLDEMTPVGVCVNMAFMVSAACVLGDHLAFTAGTAPELVNAVIIGKLAGAVTGAAAARYFAPKLLKNKTVN